MTVERFPVEAGHIMLFARAIGDANPAYYGAMTGSSGGPCAADVRAGQRPVRPGLLPATEDRPALVRLWPQRHRGSPHRRRWGWGGGGGLHAEQHYEYHRPLRAGDVLTATVRDGGTWEKQGRRGGKLVFVESITEYRDQSGELVVTARGVGVRTEKVVEEGADA